MIPDTYNNLAQPEIRDMNDQLYQKPIDCGNDVPSTQPTISKQPHFLNFLTFQLFLTIFNHLFNYFYNVNMDIGL